MDHASWPDAFAAIAIVSINGAVLVAITAPEVFRSFFGIFKRRNHKGEEE